jgi:arabinogalactan oligomer / maltooligosaccharide transport system substrate-binding protein
MLETMRPTLVEFGDLPGWVSAVSTLFALVFAAVAAVATRRAYKIESDRDRINAQERKGQEAFLRRAQAALVSAWWGSRRTAIRRTQWGAFVRNASETPVYQATLSVVNVHDPDVGERFELTVVPPTDVAQFYPSRLGRAQDSTADTPDYRVEMSFTDSTGTRWIRDPQGRLYEVFPELTIWADTQRTRILDQFTQSFLASHQVDVHFHTLPIETLRSDFLAAVKAGETPDVLVGPHDWIGNLVAHQAIEPISLPTRRRAAFTERALDAMTYGGRLYGIPYAADSIALLRNLELAPQAPATLEELLSNGRSLCAAGRAREPFVVQVGTGDGFYVYPLYTSAGGRLFVEAADGRWDPTAVAGEGTVNAFARLRMLGEQGDGILRREIDRDKAIALFTRGETPYLVCAPWGIGEARAAGMPVAVSPVPPFAGGAPARSLVAFHGFYLASTSRNKSVAQDLISHHMTRTEVAMALYAAQPRTPALRSALDKVLASDAASAIFHRQVEAGDIIPSDPEIVDVWNVFHRAEVDVVAGQPVEPVLRSLQQRLVQVSQAVRGPAARPERRVSR